MSAEQLPHGRAAQESKKQRLEREALAVANNEADLIWLADQERGRRFLRRVLDLSMALEPEQHSPNATENSKLAGMRYLGSILRSELLNNCPDQFRLLLQERKRDLDQYRANGRNTKSRPDGE